MNMAAGFGFLDDRAGFDILLSFIPYTHDDTYFRAFLVGLVNTLVVAVIGIILASVLGFLLGIAKLSRNWLLAKVATVYIETLRNIPLLLQLLFWYQAVIAVLPRTGIALPFGSILSIRGLYFPKPLPQPGFGLVLIALAAGVAVAAGLFVWARRRQLATGRQFPALRIGIVVALALPVAAFLLTGSPLSFDYPVAGRFNLTGGSVIFPELGALVLGLVLYTATFIAEIVRAGILAVPHGQSEAAHALGLRSGRTLRLVVIPQALRVIIPPLTNQYLNLTKNSSLAVAVGYPDLIGVFKNTVLNQTGHSIEVIFITMMVYLALSLATAAFMNWFNRRIALTER
jgi:general L-amino acid transport system permease protein